MMETYNDDEINKLLWALLRPIQFSFKLTKSGCREISPITHVINFSIFK
jgi:hypothetical protein